LIVVKVREKQAVSKRAVKNVVIDRLNLKKLKEEEVKEQYQVKIKTVFQLWKT
jgi:hypothetical protein